MKTNDVHLVGVSSIKELYISFENYFENLMEKKTSYFPYFLNGRLSHLIKKMYETQEILFSDYYRNIDPVFLYEKYSTYFENSRDDVVAVKKNSPFLILAVAFSLLKKRKLVVIDNWHDFYLNNQELKKYLSLVIFEESSLIELNILSLKSYWEHTQKLSVGFFTGYDIEATLFLLLKSISYPVVDTLDFLFLNGVNYEIPAAVTSQIQSYSRIDNIDSLTEVSNAIQRSRHMSMFYGHGHENCLFLGKAKIVSSIPFCEKNNTNGTLLIEHQDQDEIFQLLTSQFRSRHLFMNTCNGMRLADGIQNKGFSVGLGFIEGFAETYISTFCVKDNLTPETKILIKLLETGYLDAGSLAHTANDLLTSYSSDIPCYVLIGDPKSQVSLPESNLDSMKINHIEVYIDDNNHLNIKFIGGKALSYHITSEKYLFLSEWLCKGSIYFEYLLFEGIVKNIPDEIFYYSNKDRLLIFSEKQLPYGEINLVFSHRVNSSLDEKVFGLDELPQRFEYLSSMKLFDHKNKGIISELINNVKPISNAFKHSFISAKSAEKNKQFIDKSLNMLSRLQNLTINNYLAKIERGSWIFTENYADDFICTHKGFTEKKCNTCGRNIIDKHLEHSIYKALKRLISICPQCGTVSDMPFNKLEAALTIIKPLSEDEEVIISLKLVNKDIGKRIISIGIGYELKRSTKTNIVSNESFKEVILEQNEERELKFHFLIQNKFVAEPFYIKVLVLSSLEVGFLQKIYIF